jgi:phospholipase/carboxylesterase
MASALLPTVEVEPASKATGTVVFLHGLGADGHDFEPIVPHLRVDGIRFVFPHAPARPVAINAGYVMPAWFDIGEGDLLRGETSDLAGVKKAEEHVRALIDREVARGIATNRIVVGGFSQGGALATWVALRHPKPLAGAIALSTFMARNAPIESEATVANKSVSVFAAHGSVDQVVGIQHGRKLKDRLVAIGCDVEWHEYPMGHEVCMEEIAHWGAWLRARLG